MSSLRPRTPAVPESTLTHPSRVSTLTDARCLLQIPTSGAQYRRTTGAANRKSPPLTCPGGVGGYLMLVFVLVCSC